MNIFVLDLDPVVAASYHCDKHVVKMITESCQMMSAWATYKSLDKAWSDFTYKKTHYNHPCNIWLRESDANVWWLNRLTKALITEYDSRYGKPNKYIKARQMVVAIDSVLCNHNAEMTPFVLCMPEEYQVKGNPVLSYHNFYIGEKSKFAEWNYSPIPNWYKERL